MKTLRVLYGLVVFLGFPVLGYLLGMTIFFHFWDKVETGDLANTEHVAVAKSCEPHGPVTWRGFGTWWRCQADAVNLRSGETRTIATTGYLRPEHIGQRIVLGTTHRGAELVPERRFGGGLGMLIVIPFGIAWLFGFAYAAKPLLRKYTPTPGMPVTEQVSQPGEKPDEVYVHGRRKWLRGKWVFFILLLSVVGVFMLTPDAFEGNTRITVLAIVAWSTPLMIIGNLLRRLFVWPAVTISAAGLSWGARKLSWAEVGCVQLSAKNVLTVQQSDVEAERIGRFGPEQADEIHDAMRKYCTVRYAREVRPVPAEHGA